MSEDQAASSAAAAPPASPRFGRWAWPLLIGVLAVIGVLLAVADIAISKDSPNPLTSGIVGPFVGEKVLTAPNPTLPPKAVRFDRSGLGERFSFQSPLGLFGPISPFVALRALLSNGAGLVLVALAALLLFPARARNAVDRLEGTRGAGISLAAGVAMLLLTLAAVTLLRFTLIFLIVIPMVLLLVLAAALFGIACISLAIGRWLRRRLHLSPVHPLVIALAGALVVFDLAVIPYAGVFALAAVAIAGLGLAVVTRFGSATGWSFRDLNW